MTKLTAFQSQFQQATTYSERALVLCKEDARLVKHDNRTLQKQGFWYELGKVASQGYKNLDADGKKAYKSLLKKIDRRRLSEARRHYTLFGEYSEAMLKTYTSVSSLLKALLKAKPHLRTQPKKAVKESTKVDSNVDSKESKMSDNRTEKLGTFTVPTELNKAIDSILLLAIEKEVDLTLVSQLVENKIKELA